MLRRGKVRVPCCLIDDGRPNSETQASKQRRLNDSRVSPPKSEPLLFCEKEDCSIFATLQPVLLGDDLDSALSSKINVYFNVSSIVSLLRVFSVRRCKFLTKDFLKFVDRLREEQPSAILSISTYVDNHAASVSCYSRSNIPFIRSCDAECHRVDISLINSVSQTWTPFSDVRQNNNCADCTLDQVRLTKSALTFDEETHQEAIHEQSLVNYVTKISQNKRFSRVPAFMHWLSDVAAPLFKSLIRRELHLALLLCSVTSAPDTTPTKETSTPERQTERQTERRFQRGAGIARKNISLSTRDYSLPSNVNSDSSSDSSTTSTVQAVRSILTEDNTEFLANQTDNASDQDLFGNVSLRALFESPIVTSARSSEQSKQIDEDDEDDWLKYLTHGTPSSSFLNASNSVSSQPLLPLDLSVK